MLSSAESTNVYLHDNGTLVLESVTELEAGLYSCLARNYLGSAEVFIDVRILSSGASGTEDSGSGTEDSGSGTDGLGETGDQSGLARACWIACRSRDRGCGLCGRGHHGPLCQ